MILSLLGRCRHVLKNLCCVTIDNNYHSQQKMPHTLFFTSTKTCLKVIKICLYTLVTIIINDNQQQVVLKKGNSFITQHPLLMTLKHLATLLYKVQFFSSQYPLLIPSAPTWSTPSFIQGDHQWWSMVSKASTNYFHFLLHQMLL